MKQFEDMISKVMRDVWINNPPTPECLDNMVILITAFKTGHLDEIAKHLVDCMHCRYLYCALREVNELKQRDIQTKSILQSWFRIDEDAGTLNELYVVHGLKRSKTEKFKIQK